MNPQCFNLALTGAQSFSFGAKDLGQEGCFARLPGVLAEVLRLTAGIGSRVTGAAIGGAIAGIPVVGRSARLAAACGSPMLPATGKPPAIHAAHVGLTHVGARVEVRPQGALEAHRLEEARRLLPSLLRPGLLEESVVLADEVLVGAGIAFDQMCISLLGASAMSAFERRDGVLDRVLLPVEPDQWPVWTRYPCSCRS